MATITLSPVPASEAGALPGFAGTCPICGMQIKSSLQVAARQDAEAHLRWHEKRGR